MSYGMVRKTYHCHGKLFRRSCRGSRWRNDHCHRWHSDHGWASLVQDLFNRHQVSGTWISTVPVLTRFEKDEEVSVCVR
jgi:hypothetical protein